MKRQRIIQVGLAGAALLATIVGGTAVHSQQSHPSTAPTTAATPGSAPSVGKTDVLPIHFAVVDYQKLLAAHKDFKNLTVLDQEIARLGSSLEQPPEADPRLAKDVKKQLDDLEGQFKQRYMKEVQSAQAQLQSEQAGVQQQLKALADDMNSKFKSSVDSLPKPPSQPTLPPDFNSRKTEITAQMNSYMQDLALIRSRQIASRRLELQRQQEQLLAAHKSDMNQQLASYEAQLEDASKQERINLELQKISAKTDDDRQKIDQQLDAIKEQQDEKRQARRNELASQFDEQHKAAMAKVDSQLKTYQASIDSDTRSKVEQEQQRLVHQYFPNTPVAAAHSASAAPAVMSPQVAALKKQQEAMRAEFESRKNELVGKVQADQAAVQARLKERYAAMKNEFNAQAKAILAAASKRSMAMSGEDKKKLENIKKELVDMQAQRKRLYDRMQADVKVQVDAVAQKANIPVVVGSYLVNNKCEDLTADVLKAMAQ